MADSNHSKVSVKERKALFENDKGKQEQQPIPAPRLRKGVKGHARKYDHASQPSTKPTTYENESRQNHAKEVAQEEPSVNQPPAIEKQKLDSEDDYEDVTVIGQPSTVESVHQKPPRDLRKAQSVDENALTSSASKAKKGQYPEKALIPPGERPQSIQPVKGVNNSCEDRVPIKRSQTIQHGEESSNSYEDSSSQNSDTTDGRSSTELCVPGDISWDKRDSQVVNTLKSDIPPDYETVNWRHQPVKTRQKTQPRSERPTTSFYLSLSKEMEAQISKDESSFENINIRCRPAVIATAYESLCSNDWLTAKEELDDKFENFPEDGKHRFLCSVLQVAFKQASAYKTKFDKKLQDDLLPLLSQPLKAVGKKVKGSNNNRKSATLTDSITTSISDFLRTNVSTVDSSSLVQDISTELKKLKLPKFPGKALFNSSGIVDYIKASAELTWMMVIQRPSMQFQYAKLEEKIVEAEQEASWNSADPQNPRSKVAFIVYPALYHNEQLMVKGKVFLKQL